MKKFFVSTGLAAISAAGLQSALAAGLDSVSPKAWSISGTLRGFYDDNYNISNTKKGSWGGEVAPTVSVNLPLRQTDMGIRYNYGLYYYNDRDSLGLNPFDQTHQVEVWLDHAINEQWHVKLTDTFAVGQEPDLLQGSGAQAVQYRINGNNMANHANVSLDTQWTKMFGTSLHYGNDFYSYDNKGTTVTDTASFPAGVYSVYNIPGNHLFGNDPTQFAQLSGTGASLAGLLDRVEQSIGLDLNWTLNPETIFGVGYDFSWANYTGNEPVAVFNYLLPGSIQQSYIYSSSSRDGSSHNIHASLKRQLTANVDLSLLVGAAYSDNPNDPFNHSQTLSPSADLSLSYTYSPGCYVQIGGSHSQSATDAIQPGAKNGITQFQNASVVYVDLNHRITDKLSATLIGRFQYTTFEDGLASSADEEDYNFGLNLTYLINRHFSADLGYNFDDLVSGLNGRSYVRNRVYMGMTANF
jgi:hypothetical protein